MNIVDRYNKTGSYLEYENKKHKEFLKKYEEDQRRLNAMMCKELKYMLVSAYLGLTIMCFALGTIIYTKNFKIINFGIIYGIGLIIFAICLLKHKIKEYEVKSKN